MNIEEKRVVSIIRDMDNNRCEKYNLFHKKPEYIGASNKVFAKEISITFFPIWGVAIGILCFSYLGCWGILKILWVSAIVVFPLTFLMRLMFGCVNCRFF